MFFESRSPTLLCALWALGLVVGCSREPHARSVTGPDGSAMLHVACGRDQGACFELAGRGCPYGYKVFPIFDPLRISDHRERRDRRIVNAGIGPS